MLFVENVTMSKRFLFLDITEKGQSGPYDFMDTLRMRQSVNYCCLNREYIPWGCTLVNSTAPQCWKCYSGYSPVSQYHTVGVYLQHHIFITWNATQRNVSSNFTLTPSVTKGYFPPVLCVTALRKGLKQKMNVWCDQTNYKRNPTLRAFSLHLSHLQYSFLLLCQERLGIAARQINNVNK